jgi:glutamate-1-semialdehyde 2,1-aminomutase
MAQAPVQADTIRAEFEERFAGSKALHGRARTVIPGGITHDGRHLKPFPISVERAQGARKWDVDGHELIDYAIGHGSLLLGHNDPEIVEAVRAQLERGTHYGAGHEGEVAWAEQIRKLIPSAEQVKFTGSGTEATLLAIRLARAATGRTTILKFEGHFHGWNDYLLKSEKAPFADGHVAGIPDVVLDTVAVLPANDPAALEARLARGDVAAVIMEPSGGSWAKLPLDDGFLATVRDLATAHDAILIFDEVITGFRWSPGGAQAREGVVPDLTTLAKIVAGGLPGGAVGGRLEVMQLLAFKDDPTWNATKKVRHPGTYNANPLSAAAGLTCLRRCADPAVQAGCDELAARVRVGVNTVLEERGLPGFCWGDSSVFHIALGETAANRTAGDLRHPAGVSQQTLKQSGASALSGPLAQGMLLEGVDLFNTGGLLSIAHTEADVEHTVAAFDRVVGRMADEGLFA